MHSICEPLIAVNPDEPALRKGECTAEVDAGAAEVNSGKEELSKLI